MALVLVLFEVSWFFDLIRGVTSRVKFFKGKKYCKFLKLTCLVCQDLKCKVLLQNDPLSRVINCKHNLIRKVFHLKQFFVVEDVVLGTAEAN